jgi:pimeloyl-ACP methyl ester carboxylesterase
MEITPSVQLSSGRTLNFKYAKADKGKETVLFMHGLGRDLSYWDYHVAKLHEYGIGTLRVDLHGHGNTPDQHGDVIPGDDQIADVASLINELGIEKVRVIGHSYGGYPALMLGAESSVQDKIIAIDAWMPYVQHLGMRASDEMVDVVDNLWNLNPLHRAAMMIPWSPWSIWYRIGRAAYKGTGHAMVRATTGMGASMIERMLGRGPAKASIGLPENIIENPPHIPSRIPVRIFLGGKSSMQPGWMKLHFDSNKMAYDFAEGKSNVTVIDLKRGGHYTPGEYPDLFLDTIVAGKRKVRRSNSKRG